MFVFFCFLLLVVFSRFLSPPVEHHTDTQIFFYLYICCSVVSSCYTLIWDLKMDWGLFDRNAGENTFLREEIVYPQKVLDLSRHRGGRGGAKSEASHVRRSNPG